MKMFDKNQTPCARDNIFIAFTTLHLRISDEMSEMAKICAKVESALGQIIEKPEQTLDEPVITLQGLDRLRQSLEDMARLSKLMSCKKSNTPSESISVEEIMDTLILSGLASRLVQPTSPTSNNLEGIQDVFWK